MRNKLSSVFYMWFAFGLGIIAVLMMFTPVMNDRTLATVSAPSLFWNFGDEKGAWPAFVGYMLILAGALASAVIALPFIQPSSKVEKIVLISSIAAMVIGLVAIGLLQVEYCGFNNFKWPYDMGNIKYQVGWYLTMIFGLGAAAMDTVAVALDW